MKIIGFIGHVKIRGVRDIRHIKKTLARKLTKKYYDKDNLYMSGLKLGCDSFFAELVLYLHLQFHAVVAINKQSDQFGREDRAKFNRMMKASHSLYEVHTLPSYKIKKKQRKKFEKEYGHRYLIDRMFLQSNKFIVDMADVVIAVWDGKRAGSNVYKTLKYIEEEEKKVDVIHVGSRFNLD